MASDGTERIPEWCQNILEDLDMVTWDRFTVGDNSQAGRFYIVYGWIERESDDYKDFALVRFFPETEKNLVSYTTSSDKWTNEINRRIFGEDSEHNDCKRVEDHADIRNVIQLHEQTTLADGENDHCVETDTDCSE
jgi:hypothetical protein